MRLSNNGMKEAVLGAASFFGFLVPGTKRLYCSWHKSLKMCQEQKRVIVPGTTLSKKHKKEGSA
jgi:hypothetical protein